MSRSKVYSGRSKCAMPTLPLIWLSSSFMDSGLTLSVWPSALTVAARLAMRYLS
ncbi:hypothetical protein GALL_476340 [mine drainage metagenome]|uniref:Uncharacterized protein n=1 Tax=mine drainage metagenome TaxID=410659 RepID=A0A1J5PSP1_9ZZZZ